MAVASGWQNIKRGLSHRHFRNYQIGRSLFWTTSWMYRVSVGWTVWEMTGSAAWLGVFGFLDQAPSFIMTPLGGALADRLNPMKFLRYTQSAMLALTALLSLLLALGWMNIWLLGMFVVSYGAIMAAQMPANQSLVPSLVPREDLVSAYALNSVTFNITRFVGPMIAGIVINEWGAAPAILCNTFGAISFMIALRVMRAEFPDFRPVERAVNILAEIREGFAYVMRHKGLGPLMAMLSALSLFPYSIDLLLPSLADGVYRAGPNGLAWMTSALGVGALTTALFIAQRGHIDGLAAFVVRAVLFLGVAFVALALSDALWFALVVMFAIGFNASSSRLGSMTLLQCAVEPQLRGRAASIYQLVGQAGPAVGSLLIGVLIDWLGATQVLLGIAAITFAVWGVGRLQLPGLTAALEVEPATPAQKAAG